MELVAFLIALAAAGLMGFANQRGGTCLVAAIEEVVEHRRVGRLASMLEAALWVGGGIILLNAAHRLPPVPPVHSIGAATILGGVVFGAGAFVNRACLFGTVARLGAGEWAYAATPVGVFAGSFATARWSPVAHGSSLPLVGSGAAVALVLAIVGLRFHLHGLYIRRRRTSVLAHLWSPHVATTLVGVAFLIAFAAAGDWDYADLLRDLAGGHASGWAPKALLAGALLAGAMFGGWTTGALRVVKPGLTSLGRRFAGGALMGVGASAIPGGNTGLLLLGMPLLRPHAWVAFATIGLTIYILVRLARIWRFRTDEGRQAPRMSVHDRTLLFDGRVTKSGLSDDHKP
jgi:toxin CptA